MPVPNLTNSMEVTKTDLADVQGQVYFMWKNFEPKEGPVWDALNDAHQSLLIAQEKLCFMYSQLLLNNNPPPA